MDSLWLRSEGGAVEEVQGSRFDGTLLFQRYAEQSGPVVTATDFQELEIPGVLSVRAAVTVGKLSLEGDRCDVTLDRGSIADLTIRSPRDLAILVNGKRARSIQ